jgi:SAM-dependent methyltransferase
MGLFSPVIRGYLREIQHLAKGRLLDVGCGDKPYQSVFKNVSEYVGIDLSPKAGIPNRLKSRFEKIDVFARATELPFCSESYDVVLCTQVIAHIMDPDLFFSEVYRVLRNEGVLLATFPLINPLCEVPHEYFRYTEFSFQELCKRNNLCVEEVQKMGGGWFSIGFLARNFLYIDSERAQKVIVKRFLIYLGNVIYSLFERLDNYDRHPECPLNYLGIARKL